MSDTKCPLRIDLGDTVDAVTVNIRDLLAKSRSIALVWTIDDVRALRPDLTAEQAWEVLEYAQDIYEPESGLTTRCLDGYALHLFGPRPQVTP